MRPTWQLAKRAVVSFYDDQGTHHAAALTYYALMSLFPTLLLGVSLLGVLGQFPDTYNAITHHLGGVVPAVTLAPRPMRTGATSELLEPMKASAPTTVRYLP